MNYSQHQLFFKSGEYFIEIGQLFFNKDQLDTREKPKHSYSNLVNQAQEAMV